jgi:hypothetical protein
VLGEERRWDLDRFLRRAHKESEGILKEQAGSVRHPRSVVAKEQVKALSTHDLMSAMTDCWDAKRDEYRVVVSVEVAVRRGIPYKPQGFVSGEEAEVGDMK